MRRSLVWCLILACLAVSCGHDRSSGSGVTPAPTVPTGTIDVRFVLQSRAVPEAITRFRFYGLDANGAFTFGPTMRDKAALVTLTEVPATTTALRIEYLQGEVLRGLGTVPVSLPAGGTVEVVDPPYEDVGDQLERIEVTPLAPRIPAGVAVALRATAIHFDGTREDVTSAVQWSSSSAAATVGNEPGTFGVARGLTPGTAVLTATLRGQSDSVTLTVTGANLVRIDVGPNASVVGVRTTRQFRATGVFSDGSSHDLTNQVTWSSSDTAVAQISNDTGRNGLASTLAPGTTTITATQGGLTDGTVLTVTSANLVRLEITPGAALLPAGLQQQFQATGIFSDGTKQNLTSAVTWASSNPSVAEVSNAAGSQGRARALAAGSTNVSISFESLSAAAGFTVTSAEVASVAIEPPAATVPVGLTQPLRANATLTDGTVVDVTTNVTWTATNPAVAEISNAPGSQGVATALAVGDTPVRATLPGGTFGQGTVTVSGAVLTEIDVEPDDNTVPLGECDQEYAFGVYSDGSIRDITTFCTWSSSDENVAVIENFFPIQGRVNGVGLGTCTITAVEPVSGLQDSGSLTVTDAVIESLAIEPDDVTVGVLRITRLRAIGTFSDGTTEDLTTMGTLWSTSNPASAVVSNFPGLEGVVLGILPGPAVVTAMHDSGATATAQVQVVSP